LYPSFEECQCPQESEGKETQKREAEALTTQGQRANLPWEGGMCGTVVMVHLTAVLSRLNVTDLANEFRDDIRLSYNFTKTCRHDVMDVEPCSPSSMQSFHRAGYED